MINTKPEYIIYIWMQDSFKTQTHMAFQILGTSLEKVVIFKGICSNFSIVSAQITQP